MKILKFGGSSIANVERIENVLNIISQSKDCVAVVFSAYQSVTDNLILMSTLASNQNKKYLKLFDDFSKKHLRIAEELTVGKRKIEVIKKIKSLLLELQNILSGVGLIKELSPKTLDYILSFGERLSALTISVALKSRGVENDFLDSRGLIKTDSNFGNAKVDFNITKINIEKYFSKNKKLQILTGFIASNHNNETTTLGRGGSDYTASIFGSALNVDEVEIWTDVDGVLTADPRKVKNAFPIKNLTFNEAMELSHFGAKVIYPPTMRPAIVSGIPIRIKNSFNPQSYGTLIKDKNETNKNLIKGISSIDEISLLLVEGSGMVGVVGIAKRIFSALANKKINVILITQASSEHSICVAINPKDKLIAKIALESEFKLEIIEKQISKIKVDENFAIIAVVGENMKNTPGIAGKIFQSLGKNGINISAIAQGSSELNISIVVAKKDEVKALNVLHENLFLSKTKTLNLFLVGPGLIGKNFLSQINNQKKYLEKTFQLKINLVGIINTKKMLLSPSGIPLNAWEKSLNRSSLKSNLDDFVNEIKRLNLPNSVFVDCTASDVVIKFYNKILSSNISIVTPNKRANTQDLNFYNNLKFLAAKHNVNYLYETTVGASLPIIGTIADLVACGDKVTKLEGILSGTLSFVFNSFKNGKIFSDVIFEAREKGFTEPDPREDLSGKDVARKLLILARECGYKMELSDIKVENLIFPKARSVKSVSEFFKILKENDAAFEKLRLKEEKNGKVLRYIAKLENGKAEVSLKAIDESHPFYFLNGTDNILAVYTTNYKNSPLVIKGPGAGAEVTASGVFADVLRVSNFLN